EVRRAVAGTRYGLGGRTGASSALAALACGAARVARLAVERATMTRELAPAGVGDVVAAAVDARDAVVGVRILGQLPAVVVDAALAGPAPAVGARQLLLGRNLRRQIVVGRVADLVLAVRRNRPRRRVELEALRRCRRIGRPDLRRLRGRQARREQPVGADDDPGLGRTVVDPQLDGLELVGGGRRGVPVW